MSNILIKRSFSDISEYLEIFSFIKPFYISNVINSHPTHTGQLPFEKMRCNSSTQRQSAICWLATLFPSYSESPITTARWHDKLLHSLSQPSRLGPPYPLSVLPLCFFRFFFWPREHPYAKQIKTVLKVVNLCQKTYAGQKDHSTGSLTTKAPAACAKAHRDRAHNHCHLAKTPDTWPLETPALKLTQTSTLTPTTAAAVIKYETLGQTVKWVAPAVWGRGMG